MNHKTMKSTQNRKGKSATKEKGLKDMSKAKPKETSAMGWCADNRGAPSASVILAKLHQKDDSIKGRLLLLYPDAAHKS